MSLHGGSTAGAEASRDLHNRLHPSLDNSSDVLNNSTYEVGVQPHQALSGVTGDSKPVGTTDALGGLPAVSAIGTGALLPPSTPPHPSTDDLITPATPPARAMCTFFLRTGTCAYGDRCKFVHPRDRAPPVLNTRGYPIRPEEPDCAHYLKKGWCAFNLTCKFNHPELPPSAALPSSPYSTPAAVPPQFARAASGNFSALYFSAPSALPPMYYLGGSGPYPGVAGGYMGNSGGLPGGGYAPGGAAAGSVHRQQQQQQQGYSHVRDGVSQYQQQQQHNQRGGGDQLTNAMQKLRLGGVGESARHRQQQQR